MSERQFNFRRFAAIVVKEFIQMRRDRLTFGMMVGIPMMQLILFGFAINSNPKQLPTALLCADRFIERENHDSSLQTGEEDRRPIGVIPNLNREDAAGIEHVDLAFEVARLLIDLRKSPGDVARCLENRRGITFARQRFVPGPEERVV